MSPSESVELVRRTDKETEKLVSKFKSNDLTKLDNNDDKEPQPFVNPSQRLNTLALRRCCEKMIRADNTTCITIMLDQPPKSSPYIPNPEDDTILKANSTHYDNLVNHNKSNF